MLYIGVTFPGQLLLIKHKLKYEKQKRNGMCASEAHETYEWKLCHNAILSLWIHLLLLFSHLLFVLCFLVFIPMPIFVCFWSNFCSCIYKTIFANRYEWIKRNKQVKHKHANYKFYLEVDSCYNTTVYRCGSQAAEKRQAVTPLWNGKEMFVVSFKTMFKTI